MDETISRLSELYQIHDSSANVHDLLYNFPCYKKSPTFSFRLFSLHHGFTGLSADYKQRTNMVRERQGRGEGNLRSYPPSLLLPKTKDLRLGGGDKGEE